MLAELLTFRVTAMGGRKWEKGCIGAEAWTASGVGVCMDQLGAGT